MQFWGLLKNIIHTTKALGALKKVDGIINSELHSIVIMLEKFLDDVPNGNPFEAIVYMSHKYYACTEEDISNSEQYQHLIIKMLSNAITKETGLFIPANYIEKKLMHNSIAHTLSVMIKYTAQNNEATSITENDNYVRVNNKLISINNLDICDCRRLIDNNINKPKIYLRRGELLLSENRYNSSIVDFLHYIGMNPNDPIGFVNIGKAYYYLGNYREMHISFLRASELGDSTGLEFENENISKNGAYY